MIERATWPTMNVWDRSRHSVRAPGDDRSAYETRREMIGAEIEAAPGMFGYDGHDRRKNPSNPMVRDWRRALQNEWEADKRRREKRREEPRRDRPGAERIGSRDLGTPDQG